MFLTEIIPNPSNPRLIKDDKFKKLVQSIKDFPAMMELRPIITDENGMVLGGNMRLQALKEAGYTEVPESWVKRTSSLTEAEKAQFIIKDNVGFGEWNWETLANEWDKDDLENWGLDLPVNFNLQDAQEDDYEIPDEIETDIILGDLFEIGEHRLLCGDSTHADDAEKLMNGEKAEIIFTSPPYSDMRTYEGGKDLSISNLVEFIPTFHQYVNYLVINLGIQRKDNEIVEYWDEYIETAKNCGYKFLSWNVWDRMQSGSIAHQTAMFSIHHEWIFVFGEKFKPLHRTVENNTVEYFKRHPEAEKTGKATRLTRQKDGSLKQTESAVHSHRQIETVTRVRPQLARDEFTAHHPAMFPIDFPAEYINAMTNENDFIVDPFIGSGTTMVAAHQLNRKCYGMEIDPKYCQVIIDRMLKLDPSLEIKKNGVKITEKSPINA